LCDQEWPKGNAMTDIDSTLDPFVEHLARNKTPQQLIETGQEVRVSDLLRILMTADLS
jgi:hypothetical protein